MDTNKSFDNTLQWAISNLGTKSKEIEGGSSLSILMIVGLIVVVLLVIWWVISIWPSQKTPPTEEGMLNEMTNHYQAYADYYAQQGYYPPPPPGYYPPDGAYMAEGETHTTSGIDPTEPVATPPEPVAQPPITIPATTKSSRSRSSRQPALPSSSVSGRATNVTSPTFTNKAR